LRDRAGELASSLGEGERKLLDVAMALVLKPKLLIMDEPTSVLTPQEVEKLFGTLRQIASEGCAILYISHKLHEIKALCDTATILRAGKVVATCDPKHETSRSMAEKMIGTNLKDIVKPTRSFGTEKLIVSGLSIPASHHFGTSLVDVSFAVRAGEIFGIAGVAGNGQSELLLALDGELQSDPQAISIDGHAIGGERAAARRKRGLCSVPEERNGHAAIADFTLSDNSVLTARDRLSMVTAGLIRPSAARSYTGKVISSFAVKAQGPTSTAGSLSGGNLQKFIMGREILQDPAVLVVNQPTWGVDAGAAAAIHQSLVDLAAKGSAIVVISQDLDELLTLSDGLAVINQGRLSPVTPMAEVAIDEIGLLMGGVHGDPKATAELAHDPHLADLYDVETAHAH
jgi:ABC-type uncharacterized transport system ATPase subunit